MDSAVSNLHWQANPAVELHSLHWGDSIVVYNNASGQTHFLNEFAHHLFQMIESSSGMTRDMLCETIASDDDIPLDERLQSLVDQLLATLDELGLIEPKEMSWRSSAI